jgi:hypothetical protein
MIECGSQRTYTIGYLVRIRAYNAVLLEAGDCHHLHEREEHCFTYLDLLYVLKGHKKDEYTRKKACTIWLCKNTGAKKGGAQEHLHVFHKIPPSVFLVSFMLISFQFLFNHSSISAWRGHGFYNEFLHVGAFGRENAYGIEGIAPWSFLFCDV